MAEFVPIFNNYSFSKTSFFPPHVYQALHPATEIVNFCLCLCVFTFAWKHLWGPKRLPPSAWCKPCGLMQRKELLLGSWILQSSELMSSSALRLASVGALDLWSQLEEVGLLSYVLLGMDLPEKLTHQRTVVHPSLTAKYTLCLILCTTFSRLGTNPQTLQWVWTGVTAQHSYTAPLHQGQLLPDVLSEEDH